MANSFDHLRDPIRESLVNSVRALCLLAEGSPDEPEPADVTIRTSAANATTGADPINVFADDGTARKAVRRAVKRARRNHVPDHQVRQIAGIVGRTLRRAPEPAA